MLRSYQKVKEKLSWQLKGCRDRDIRIKANLILLACKLQNVDEACERRGFSRKFFYKWYGRLKKSQYCLASLSEISRRPKKKHPKITPKNVEVKIRILAKRGYGSPLIKAMLGREGIKISRSTIVHILNHRRKGVVKTRKQKLKAHRRRYELPIPGMRVQLDVKYVPEPVAGFRAYNYVAIDECTRIRFAFAYYDLNPRNTVDFLCRMIRFFPFDIETIQTDNGFEFTNRLIPAHEGLEHPMDTWCNENGIKHRCIPVGEKELNGKVERSHRIDEQFFYWKAPTASLEEFNFSFLHWLFIYNHERLHGGLDFKTPIEKLWEVYEKERRLPNFELNKLKDLPKRFTAYKNSYAQEQNNLRKIA
jgi:transposase InsO family protein